MEFGPELQRAVEEHVRGQLGPDAVAVVAASLSYAMSPSRPSSARIRTVSNLVLLRSPNSAGASSVIRARNVTLNFRKLFLSLSSGALAVTTYADKPWAAILSLLTAAVLLEDAATVRVGEAEAAVAWAVHRHANERKSVAKSDLVRLVNLERARFGEAALSRDCVDTAIHHLRELRCLKPISGEPGRIRLGDWIIVSYRYRPA